MAAHLHDSVLQTLALIVRAEAPGEMRTLARGQERELRAWLYGRAQRRDADLLSTAIDATAAEVEAMHGALIDVVMVGDCQLDDGVRALVDACREAMINAAKHSGAAAASVYIEIEDDRVTAFVPTRASASNVSGCLATVAASSTRSQGVWSATGGTRWS